MPTQSLFPSFRLARTGRKPLGCAQDDVSCQLPAACNSLSRPSVENFKGCTHGWYTPWGNLLLRPKDLIHSLLLPLSLLAHFTPMFEQTFKNIDDVLHKDAGCTSELEYTEQSSWLLFLKYPDSPTPSPLKPAPSLRSMSASSRH
jgi:hypothetical protein